MLGYFHISDPSIPNEMIHGHTRWILLEEVRQASSKYYTPQTNISIDEAMVRFCGRSHDIFKVLNKPIDEGYKAFCLADYSCVFDFRFTLSTL